ncbi:hypothetical protein Fot_52233 [Forsythia ovata]|uniref:Uncharacterized protein n=1 Tax=Forsythia ovata TaxID=205694 RepID=A0ABD1PK51_9LAMI
MAPPLATINHFASDLTASIDLSVLQERLTNMINLDDIVEVSYNKNSGFVWVKQKKSKVHQFHAIGRSVSYDTEVTAFVEDRRMRKLIGVKSKELLLWITISDIYIQDPSSGKITFGTPTGISRTFPVSAFEEEDKKVKN